MVRVTKTDSSVKEYPAGNRFEKDGYGDYVIYDGDRAIGFQKRANVEEVEVVD